jgi:hypothetical protein
MCNVSKVLGRVLSNYVIFAQIPGGSICIAMEPTLGDRSAGCRSPVGGLLPDDLVRFIARLCVHTCPASIFLNIVRQCWTTASIRSVSAVKEASAAPLLGCPAQLSEDLTAEAYSQYIPGRGLNPN